MRAIFVAISAILYSAVLHGQLAPELTYEVSGTVVNSSTGAGVTGALVQVGGSAPNSNPVAIRLVTDASGSFSVKVPATAFLNVNVSRNGYQPAFRRFTNVADAKAAKDLRIRLAPESAIEGRVLNSDGEPVQGMSVQLLRSSIRNGRRYLDGPTGDMTNDLGEYRLWGLIAGDYYVKLSGRYTGLASAGPAFGILDPREAYPTVFYPAAPDLTTAQMIHLAPGQTARADFRANPKVSYSVRGRLTGIKLQPSTGMRLLIGDTPVLTQAHVDPANGTFTVVALLPGTYTLQAISPGEIVGFGEASVVISDHDVTGLVIPMSNGVTVQGTVQHIGTPDGKAPPVTISAELWDSSREIVPRFHPPPQTKPDGSFTLDNMLPGRYRIQVQGLVHQYVESIRSGPTDVLADGLTVGTTSPAELIIVPREGGGSLHVTVTGLPKGEFPLVVVIPQTGSASEAQSFAPMDGKVTATNLAPGKYSLYAWSFTRQVEYMNPDALRASGAPGVTVIVTEGAQQDVTVVALAGDEQ